MKSARQNDVGSKGSSSLNTMKLIEEIAEKGFDVDAFVKKSIEEAETREEIVHQMITNKDIMVYYHCYYVVEKVSRQNPELYFPYWDDIAGLLNHKNSYHRDFGLEIIGNLCQADNINRFAEIENDYLGLINDEKFMTGNCCVQNLLKIYKYKVDLREKIIDTLLDIDNRADYTEKQLAVLKSDVLEILDYAYALQSDKSAIEAFIKNELDSISPKTRQKARQLVQKYGI
jgi:hypothetical protein